MGKNAVKYLGEAGFHPMGGFSDQKILVLGKFEHMLNRFNVR